jgi:chitinase
MQLTMAAAANPGTLRWLDTAFLSETMDWINVMTYDMAGDWSSYAGHNAPLFASSRQPEGPPRSLERTIDFLLRERKLPPDRIALGIPLYGRGFSVKEPYASTKGIARNRIPGGGNYANLKKLLDEQDWTRQWDHETKTPWLLAPDRSTVIGYDDVESVIAKTKWAVKQGLRGVFFWQIHGDRLPDNTHPLQEAAKRSMPAPVPSTAPGPG